MDAQREAHSTHPAWSWQREAHSTHLAWPWQGRSGTTSQWLYKTKTSQGRVSLRSRHLNVSTSHLNLNSYLQKPSDLCREKLQSPGQPEPVRSELAAVGRSSVSRVRHSPGPALPGAGSRMDLPALKHGVSAESSLQRWNQL